MVKVNYNCPASPLKVKTITFETDKQADAWIKKFRDNYGPTWVISKEYEGDALAPKLNKLFGL